MLMNNTVSVVISTRKIDEAYLKHVEKMFSHPKTEILIYENDGVESLPQIYNMGLKDSKNDIVVFMHDDLIIETKSMNDKIVKLFSKNPEFGIIGIAGTTDLINGRWWEIKESMCGKVMHEKDGKRWTSKYSKESYPDKVKEVVVVDGLFFAVCKSRIANTFDESFKGFHFYDISFCVSNYISGVKIGLTTKFDIVHKSIGQTNDNWEENKLLFEEKFKSNLPIRLTNNKTWEEKLIVDWDKVGLAMVTYNSEKRIKQSAFTVPDHIKHFYIVNDGTPYSDECYPANATIIQHEKNKGVGGAKNTALQALMDAGCEHLFLMEDDVLIKDKNVFEAYILTSLISGIKHMNYALQGPANVKRKDGFASLDGEVEPNPRQVVEYPEKIKVALYPNCVGAFSYYHRSVIQKIGLFDTNFKNAWEHVDHTLVAHLNKFTTPFWWFADVGNSYDYLDNIENCIEESTIRRTDSFNKDFEESTKYFEKKHKVIPMQIQDSAPEQINGILQHLYSSR